MADLVVCASALLSTPVVPSEDMLERHAPSMPSFWVMAAVLAWSAARGWVAGIVAAAVMTACDLSVRLDVTGTTWGDIFLLVHGEAVTRVSGPVTGPDVDLVESLAVRAPAHVAVSGPGTSVVLPTPVAEELAAAVRACLDNVARHVGDRAPAWVLVEDLGESVVVTVRDEGPGIPEGRLEDAAAEGRMGVTGSIRARLADLGGTAELVTAPGAGTEWELTVPRR